MLKKSKSYSILFVPDGSGRTIHFRVRSATFKVLITTCLIFILGAIISIVFTGRIAAKLQLVNNLVKQNQKLVDENKKIILLAVKLDEIKAKEEKIKKIATNFIAGSNLSEKNDKSDLVSSKRMIDEFVLGVGIKQKASESKTQVVGDTRSVKMLSAIPTLRPIDGWITRNFTLTTKKTSKLNEHEGVDFAAQTGATILASAGGIVTFSGWDKNYGELLIINHGFGYESFYGHCSRLLVSRGDLVKRGESIALVGNSGASSAPHLHYEIRKNGISVDPLLFFIH